MVSWSVFIWVIRIIWTIWTIWDIHNSSLPNIPTHWRKHHTICIVPSTFSFVFALCPCLNTETSTTLIPITIPITLRALTSSGQPWSTVLMENGFIGVLLNGATPGSQKVTLRRNKGTVRAIHFGRHSFWYGTFWTCDPSFHISFYTCIFATFHLTTDSFPFALFSELVSIYTGLSHVYSPVQLLYICLYLALLACKLQTKSPKTTH